MIDVFAYLLAKRPRIRAGGFKPYLYKSARNMALRHKSRRRPCSAWKRWRRSLRARISSRTL